MMDYSGTFDGDFVMALRERKPTNLSTMMKATVEVESNVLVSQKSKLGGRRNREENQPSTSSSTEVKLDLMMKTMNLMFEKMTVDNRHPPREHHEPQVRNKNFKRPPV